MRILLASTLALGLGASCVNQDGSVFIEGAAPMPDNCEPTLANAAGFLPKGILDIAAPRSYTAALQVVTNLPSTFNNTNVSDDKSKSPNYPAYGATDNNVIILDSVETAFSFPANPDIVAPDAFQCDDTTCSTNENARTVTALAGSVFNTQTQLNGKQLIFAEALSATLSTDLAAAFDAVLKTPDDRVTVVADMIVKGTTTGNGDLRPLTTFSFPLPIEVCIGCIEPTEAVCGRLNAVPVATGASTCFAGQDSAGKLKPTAQCECVGAPGVEAPAGGCP
jgi:hypothetical protein